MRQHQLTSPSPGFTLIELILVLSIFACLGLVAYPPMAGWVAGSRIDNASRIVAGDLRLAVSLASRQGTPIRIDFDEAAQSYTLIDRASAEVVHRRALGPGTEVPIGTSTASVARVDVFPNHVASGPIAITLVAGEHRRRVEMTSAGFIRVVRP